MGAAVKKAEVMIPGDGGRAERLRFSMDAGLLKDVYVHDYVWSADGLTVAWELVEGHKRRAERSPWTPRSKGSSAGWNCWPDPLLASLTAALHRRILPLMGRAASRSLASQFRR